MKKQIPSIPHFSDFFFILFIQWQYSTTSFILLSDRTLALIFSYICSNLSYQIHTQSPKCSSWYGFLSSCSFFLSLIFPCKHHQHAQRLTELLFLVSKPESWRTLLEFFLHGQVEIAVMEVGKGFNVIQLQEELHRCSCRGHLIGTVTYTWGAFSLLLWAIYSSWKWW